MCAAVDAAIIRAPCDGKCRCSEISALHITRFAEQSLKEVLIKVLKRYICYIGGMPLRKDYDYTKADYTTPTCIMGLEDIYS